METQASVLIIDDDPEMCDWLGAELRRHGYEVATARDCQAAESLVSRRPFNLALIDYRLPTENGLDTLRALRELDPDLEAIVLTAYATIPNVVDSLRGGAYDFVSKPFTVRDLLPRLKAAIEKSELRGLVALHEASRALIGARSKPQVASRVVEVARRLLACDAGAVAYLGGVHVDAGGLPAEETDQALRYLLATHVDTAEPVRVGPGPWSAKVPALKSAVVLPLTGAGGPNEANPGAGIVVLLRQQDLPPFTAADVRRARVFAAQVTLALENAHLGEALELRLREATEARTRLIEQEKLALTGQLAAGVAHELANPLSYVLTNLATMEHVARRLNEDAAATGLVQAEVEELATAANDALNGVLRMQGFVRDLRVFARPGAEQPGRVDLRECVNFAHGMLRARLTGRCRVETHYRDLPPVLASKSRLEQVFVNLLANASDAVGPGDHLVEVHAHAEQGWVVCTVSDDGPGVPPEVAEHIFEPFFTTKAEGGGSGLGLSICRQIVDAYGGALTYAPRTPGPGATFTLRLPAAT